MHIPETVKETAEEAKEGAKHGMKSGARKLVGELVENIMLVLGGVLGYRFFHDRDAKKHAEELRERASHIQDPVARAELEREAVELTEKLAGWGMADEVMSFSTFTRVATHFQKIGKPETMRTMLATIRSMSESNKERLRRSLNKIASEDDRVERVIQFAEADPETQAAILDVSNIELKPEEQAGHVLRTEFGAMKERLSTRLDADLQERWQKSLERRNRHQQRIEDVRKRKASKPTKA